LAVIKANTATTPVDVQLAELDQIYQTAPVGLALMDCKLRYLRVNEQLAKFHRLPAEDHIGLSIFDVIPEIAPKVESIIEATIESGEPILDQDVAAATDASRGEIRYWRSSYYPIKSDTGEVQAVSVVVQEITAFKRAEQKLRESETRYSMATASGSVGLWDWDLCTDEIYVDPVLKKLLGYEDDEIRNHIDDWGSHVHPDDAECVMREAQAHLAGKTPRYEVEHRMIHKDGSSRWFLARGIAMRGDDGEPYRMVGTDTCITDMKLAQQTIRDNQKQLKEKALILTQVQDAVVSTDMERRIQTWNKGAEQIYGYTAEEMIGKPIDLVVFPEDQSVIETQVLKPFRRKGFFRGVIRNRTKAGKEVFIDLNLTMLRDENGIPIGQIGCSHDITEKRAQQEDLLRIVSHEQRKIGQELHDTIGQELVGLGFLAQNLIDTLSEDESPELQSAQSLRAGLDRSLSQIRALSRGFIPDEIESSKLCDAIADLAHRTEELGDVDCRFTKCAAPLVDDDRIATHLYRIAQESVTNALTHASPERIDMSLTRDDHEICLVVEDDGKGFSENDRESGMGQRIMAFRAELIEADLEIETDSDKGTRVVGIVPTDRSLDPGNQETDLT
jgi:PAS domain S-box-containing protein